MKTCTKTEGGTMAISQHVLAQLMINDAHLGFGAEPGHAHLSPAPRPAATWPGAGQMPVLLPPCLAPLQAAGNLLCARDKIAWTCTAPYAKNSPATSTKNSCARTTEGGQTKIQHRRNKIESNQPPRGQEEEKASFPIDL